MIHTIFEAKKNRQKITAAELENQVSNILPTREELVVMDYSVFNNSMPYYSAAQTPYYSNNYPTFQPDSSSYASYRPDYNTLTQYPTYHDSPSVPNYYNWSSYGSNSYTYSYNPPQYDYNCDYDYKVDPRWDNDWNDHKNDHVDIDRHKVDNWDNWRYQAYIYTNPRYDQTRLA